MRGRTILLLAFVLGLSLRVAADTYDTHTLVAVTTRDAEDVRALHDVRADIVGRKGAVYRALLTPGQLEQLTALGLRIEILRAEMEEDRRRWAENDAAAAAMLATSYYTASKFDTVSPPAGSLMEHLLQQYNAHPDIRRLYNLGATQDGAYDIIAIKVSKNPDAVEAEPKIRIYGNIHGDEKGAAWSPPTSSTRSSRDTRPFPRTPPRRSSWTSRRSGSSRWGIPTATPTTSAATRAAST